VTTSWTKKLIKHAKCVIIVAASQDISTK